MRTTAAALALGMAFVAGILRAQAPPYDLLIRNARVVDGSGSLWYRSDVGILGDEIALFSCRNWRCPACDKYLGKAMSPRFCAKCGVSLQ